MSENDRKLLAELFKVVREVAPEFSACGDSRLERALDRYDLRAEDRIA